MAIVYVGGQTGSRAGSTSTSNITYSLSGGTNTTPQAGDLVIITVTVGSAGRNPACAITTPSGFTALGLLNASAATQDTSLDASWKIMGQIPDTTFTLPSTGNVQDAQAYTVQVFRNIDNTPLDVTSVSATGTGTDRPNPGSITPSTSGAYVVICGGGGAATGAVFTAPANYTTNFRTTTQADTNDVTVGSGYRAWTSGAEDPAAYGGGANLAADSWCAYTLALRPSIGFADDSIDEGNEASSFYNQVSSIARKGILATALLASYLGTNLANSHQDELPPPPTGTTGGFSPDLWSAKSNTPRITNLYANDEIVAQAVATPVDDGTGFVQYTVKPVIALPNQYYTDDIVPQPTPTLVDDYWPTPYSVRSLVSVLPPYATDEIVSQPSTIIDESEWIAPFSIKPIIALDPIYSTDAIGQVATFGDTGGFIPDLWPAKSTTPRTTYLYADDSIVAQPTPINIDESDWSPPFTIAPFKWISIEQTQDERVTPASTISVDESDSPPFVTVDGKTWIPVPWQYGYGEGSVWGPIDEDYHFDLGTKRITNVSIAPIVDEVIVQQPTAMIDEVYWVPGFSIAKVPNTEVNQTDEVVIFIPISIDEGEWTPPFNTKSPIWVLVSNTQDEIVPPPVPINVTEDYNWPHPIIVNNQRVMAVLITMPFEPNDSIVEQPTPPIPPIPPIPPVIHGKGKYRLIPSMDVVDRVKFPQDNVGTSNC